MSAEMSPTPEPTDAQPSPATLASQEVQNYLRLAENFPADSPEAIELTQRADRAFSQMYELSIDRVRGAIGAVATSFTFEDFEDIVQETYDRASRGLNRFRGDSEVETWLYRIAHNASMTHLKRKIRRGHEALPDELTTTQRDFSQPTGDEITDNNDLRDRLQEGLRRLSPRYRAVIVLRDVYDLTHEEIAQELGISVSASKVRLHRARQQLKEFLFSKETDEQS